MPRVSRSDFRLFLLGVLMILGLAAIVLRLWVLQVMRGEIYAKRVGSDSHVTVRIPSVRGEIRDRNGLPLVQNRASYNVDFYLPDMVSGYRQRNGKLPRLTEERPIHGMKRDVDVDDIIKIVNDGVIPRLQDLDLARDYNAKRLKKHYDTNGLVPFTYIEDIDFPTIAKFSEHDVGLPGVDINVKPVRQYLYGSFAAHILGYVGMPRQIDQQPDVKNFNYYQPNVEGKNQIEQAMDKYLRGTPGVRVLRRNAKNMLDREVRVEPPKAGANVYLTLDARIQYIVELALRHPTLGRAAAVVLDPNNGDILAMASVPSFDPNAFIPSISVADWNKLMKDEAVPLVNRAVSGFPPGSTFKIVTAIAGLTKGIGMKKFNCPGGIQYGDHYFRCWISEKHGQHGMLGLSDAMKVSCNSFFYQYGNDAGGDTMERVGAMLGMGRRYEHLGLTDEKAGIMPGPEWMRARYPNVRWTSAYTANTAIGQGSVLASPLQMAAAYAMVANGGTAYEPRLVKTVLNADGTPVLDEEGHIAVPDEPIVRGDLHGELNPEQIEELRRGLWKVVNQSGGPGGNGTGSKGRVKGTVVAGKTGTAQASDRGKREHIAWFCSFAPYDNPRYAIAVMVQGGEHGGSVAAPIASHILEQCLALDQGTLKVDVKPLAPARGSRPFAPIEALPDYKDTGLLVVNEDESDSVQTAPSELQMGGGSAARPDINEGADERGKVKKATRKPEPQRVERAEPDRRGQPRRQQVEEPRRNIFQRLFRSDRKSNQEPPPRRVRP